MATEVKKRLRATPVNAEKDPEAFSIIYGGANASQLREIFKVGFDEINAALVMVKPCDVRRGVPVYHIRDAAPYICKPVIRAEDIASHIKMMSAHDLPMTLRKEFWIAQKAEQEYKLKAGDLWPTTEVIENVGKLYQIVKMGAQLMSDQVERQVELTERQRQIIKNLTDGLLEELRKEIAQTFTQKQQSETHEPPEVEDDDAL